MIGVIPLLRETTQNHKYAPKLYDTIANERSLESKRHSVLEQENTELKTRVAILGARPKRCGQVF
ncbi:hypothetical protein DET50_1209 [Marinobacter pelagius]|uniref:Uncharacterized protein n=1 Tax=Marinobacter pelagius TaxID=379482 RepID=A0A366GHU9_9GAMM|nr:hypothetical protein DET50_1209 [Marinobacter pelagius]